MFSFCSGQRQEQAGRLHGGPDKRLPDPERRGRDVCPRRVHLPGSGAGGVEGDGRGALGLPALDHG